MLNRLCKFLERTFVRLGFFGFFFAFVEPTFVRLGFSPIGAKGFFSEWGLMVLKNEILWIWLPTFLVVLLAKIVRGKIHIDREQKIKE